MKVLEYIAPLPMKTPALTSSRRKISQQYSTGCGTEWMQSGNAYFARLEALIDSAKHELHLQTYIFSDDETGRKIGNALMRASQRKVAVFVLVDAYGSQKTSAEFINELLESGVHFKKYGQLYSRGSLHLGRRMHHKILVIDGYLSTVGGVNISDNYNDTARGKAWLDFVAIMQGEVSKKLMLICRRRWEGEKFYSPLEKLFNFSPEDNNQAMDSIYPACRIRIRRNDFIRNRHDIAITYRRAFRTSKKTLYMVGGYFLPGGKTRRLMKQAIRQGVSISIIVSKKSDVPVLIYARRYLYAWLHRQKINVYEYEHSNVHGKVLIVDGAWTSIGSYDLNNLSTFSNIELNVDIESKEFSLDVQERLKEIISKDCEEVTGKSYRDKNPLNKLMMWLSYRIVKTFFVLSFLLAGKRRTEF